jgi:radical SAM protein with 4Fe4S-binding SPASM domain
MHRQHRVTETIEYLADLGIENINLIQLLDVNGTSSFNDPLLHYSEGYVAWIKRSCISMAKSKRIRLIWSIAGYFEYDFRKSDYVTPNPRKNWNDDWDFKMKLMFPGFCRNAYGRLRVDSEGDVAPCCYATQGELSLGNLNKTNFETIWNGPSAQDLRRGMYTGDVPALCKSCRYHDPIHSLPSLDFVEQCEKAEAATLRTSDNPAVADVDPMLPNQASRHNQKPNLRIRKPLREIKDYYVGLSIGGQSAGIIFVPISIAEAKASKDPSKSEPMADHKAAESVELELPDSIWAGLDSNVGYWWMVWGVPTNPDQQTVRLTSTRCFIKHQSLPRIEGSELRYHDQGFVPITDLGGAKKVGWSDQNQVPERPTVAAAELSKPANPAIQSLVVPSNGDQPSNVLSRMIGKVLGSQVKLRPIVLDGYIDSFEQADDALQIRGWLLLQDGAADSIEIVSRQDETLKVSPMDRPDLMTAFPKVARANQAGYQAVLPDDQFWVTDHYEFYIVAKRGTMEAFRCLVTLPTQGESENFPAGPHATRDRVVSIVSLGS